MARIARPLPFLLGCLLALTPVSGHAEDSKYYVPPSRFVASVQVTGESVKPISGVFEEATGSFSYDNETFTISRMRLAINTQSLKPAKPSHEKGLKNLFNNDMSSEITFASTAPATVKDGSAEIKGTLTVLGQGKPAALKATFANKEPHGASLPLSLTGSFKRDDYGIEESAETETAPDGSRVVDTITLTFDLQSLRM